MSSFPTETTAEVTFIARDSRGLEYQLRVVPEVRTFREIGEPQVEKQVVVRTCIMCGIQELRHMAQGQYEFACEDGSHYVYLESDDPNAP